MRSNRPKPLHRLCGRPMVLHVLDALAELEVDRVVVVVGHRGEWVTKTLIDHAPPALDIEFVEQVEPARDRRRGRRRPDRVAAEDDEDGDVVVLPGDTPLLRPPTLAALVRHHREHDAGATLLTAEVADPTRLRPGRAGPRRPVARVVEDADATDDERAVREINTSIYCFRRSLLAPALRRLSPANAQGEYYLTDVVGVLYDAGYRVQSLVVGDPMEAAGVNDRAQLAVAEAELRDRINERWMRRGVTMWDPERTYVDAEVQLAPDVVLLARGDPAGEHRGRRGGRDRSGLHPGRHRGGGAGRGPHRSSCTAGARSAPGPGSARSAPSGPGAVVAEGSVVPPFTRAARGSGLSHRGRAGSGPGGRPAWRGSVGRPWS